MNGLTKLTAVQLRRAADLKEQIEQFQAELDRILAAPSHQGNSEAASKRRHMGAAARAAIAAAARARWAKIKGKAAPAQKPRRKMSAAARARLAQIARARWKKAKAAGKRAL
jgi:hypothetical protein